MKANDLPDQQLYHRVFLLAESLLDLGLDLFHGILLKYVTIYCLQ